MSTENQKKTPGKITGITLLILFVCLIALGVSKATGFIESNQAQQGFGIVLGLILVLLGNFLPKLVLPLSQRGDDPHKAIRNERMAGMLFVLTGALIVSVWLFVTQEYRMMVSSVVGLSVISLVFAQWAHGVFGGLSESQIESKLERLNVEIPLSQRLAVFGILYTLFWVFAMFLADAVWGDSVAQGMVIPFIIISAVLLSFMTIKHQFKR